MKQLLDKMKSPLGLTTGIYLVAWLLMVLERASSHILPSPIYWIVYLSAFPLGMVWIYWCLRPFPKPTRTISLAASLIFTVWWTATVFILDEFLLDTARASVARWGTGILFFIGLSWTVWFVERKSRAYQLLRTLNRPTEHAVRLTDTFPPKNNRVGVEGTVWNPLDAEAWYYGRRGGRRLNQSIVTLISYSFSFLLAFLILTNLRGCQEIYELPAGGGEEKTITQKVKIQKVIHKKYIVNPYSAILFNERKIDDVVLQLNEITEHQYTIGQGEGVGAGFGGGKPRGKVRFIRLEYTGGDWDQDFGVGGDLNMLFEYHIRTSHQVSDKTESRRVAELKNFPMGQSPPLIYMTGQKNISLSASELKILREYLLDKHGMIFCDNGGSAHFHNQFLSLMSNLLPDVQPVPVPLDDQIHRVPFAIPFLPYVAPHGGKEALGWYKDGRWICYYHPGDIGDAWADGHAGVKPEITEACYQLGTNVIFYAHAEYNKWLEAQKK
jgi:hypothetical protein